MATKKEINDFLKKSGYTFEQMQTFWDDLQEVNPKVRSLVKSGKNWSDLSIFVIRNIPTQKQRDLEAIEEKKKKEEEKTVQEEKERKEKEFYQEHFEEIMLRKIDDSNEELSEQEIRELIERYELEGITDPEIGRWVQYVSTIVKLGDRYFRINWERGLTEYQENSFLEQPYEVNKCEKTILECVSEWVAKDNASKYFEKFGVQEKKIISGADIAQLFEADTQYEVIQTENGIVVRRR